MELNARMFWHETKEVGDSGSFTYCFKYVLEVIRERILQQSKI